MIEQWFKQDITAVLSSRHRVVICDPSQTAGWLVNFRPKGSEVITVKNAEDEFEARYKVGKDYQGKDIIFYVTMSFDGLTFLTEYAETCGLLDLTDAGGYIKKKAYEHLHENTALDSKSLMIAAKVSKGKDDNWWRGILKGIINPLDVKQLLLSLLANPKAQKEDMEEDVWNLFRKEVYTLVDIPDTNQKPEALANEVSKKIFDGLVDNSISNELLEIYYSWADKSSMRESLEIAIDKYSLSSEASPLNAHPDHPFEELDKHLFMMLGNVIKNNTDTSALMHALHARLDSKKAQSFKSGWLKDAAALMDFEMPNLFKVTSIAEFSKFYQNDFAKLDTAMRNIYVAWLNDTDALRPLQEQYEQHEMVLLDKWFSLIKDYTPNQQGLLQKALSTNARTAVIVGDGLRLEMAEVIAKIVETYKKASINKDVVYARIPSVTENGMSALYGCDDIDKDAQNRFTHFKTLVSDVEIMPMSQFNECVTANKLILNYGDIDEVTEKKQLSGLKDISNYPLEIAEMIKRLINLGYEQVYITADHGFVLTGILDDAQKIPAPQGNNKILERFVLTNEQIDDNSLIEQKSDFLGYKYQYFYPSDKPFVSKGSYGYAHGGFTPQECIIPFYCFSSNLGAQQECKISIDNKSELSNIASLYFTVKLKAEGDASSLFGKRKIKVLLYDGSKQKNEIIIDLKAGETKSQEFEKPKKDGKIVVVDALSTQQLDYCDIKNSTTRDFGGLL